jgi:glutamate racemase
MPDPQIESSREEPVGVFDSGVGGLTVLRALVSQLPGEDFLYLGDTARLPYGTKSPSTVARYSVRAAEALVERGVKALVVACNTASSTALPALRERFPHLPVIGVIEPGARAACEASASGRIAVLATEGTVAGGAYQRAIHALRPTAQVTQVACQVFVALAEEGWSEGEAVDAVSERYLAHLDDRVDTVVLGCTHFPLLSDSITRQLGPTRRVVDSAATTARATAQVLSANQLGARRSRSGTFRLMATDSPERFARVGARFLGSSLAAGKIEAIDL